MDLSCPKLYPVVALSSHDGGKTVVDDSTKPSSETSRTENPSGETSNPKFETLLRMELWDGSFESIIGGKED